jgi:hypothetical protein
MKVEQEYFSHAFRSPFKCRLIGLARYMLAAAATANTVHNSREIGFRAVITFSCHQSRRLPLGWYSFSIGIYILGIAFTHSTLRGGTANGAGYRFDLSVRSKTGPFQ